jgi:hypothetical protein
MAGVGENDEAGVRLSVEQWRAAVLRYLERCCSPAWNPRLLLVAPAPAFYGSPVVNFLSTLSNSPRAKYDTLFIASSAPCGYPAPPAKMMMMKTELSPDSMPPNGAALAAAIDGESPPRKLKRPRAAQACERCRTKKYKCDESIPCFHCKKSGIDCVYQGGQRLREEAASMR